MEGITKRMNGFLDFIGAKDAQEIDELRTEKLRQNIATENLVLLIPRITFLGMRVEFSNNVPCPKVVEAADKELN